MNQYRQLYNKVLDIKFDLNEIVGKYYFKSGAGVAINLLLIELDELATDSQEHVEIIDYEDYINGKCSHLKEQEMKKFLAAVRKNPNNSPRIIA